jgi:hypothetical protein
MKDVSLDLLNCTPPQDSTGGTRESRNASVDSIVWTIRLNRGKQPSFSFSLTNAGAIDSNQRWPFSERRRLDSFIKIPPVFLVSLPWPPPTAGKRNYGEQKQTLRPCPKRTWVLGQRTVDLLTVTLLASLGTVPNPKS